DDDGGRGGDGDPRRPLGHRRTCVVGEIDAVAIDQVQGAVVKTRRAEGAREALDHDRDGAGDLTRLRLERGRVDDPVGWRVEAPRGGRQRQQQGGDHPSFFLRISLTSAGFALPPVLFITWPTNQPKVAVFPLRYISTCDGLAAITWSTAASM